MKASFRWTRTALLAVCVAAGAASCSNEDVDSPQTDVIRLTSKITPVTATRGTSLDQQNTQIVAGQLVGVTVTGALAEHNNVGWSAESNGELTNTGETLYWGTGTATIYAYHPYNAAWTCDGTNQEFSVQTDQSGDGYLASDLL